MSKLTARWLSPGATVAYSLVMIVVWFGYRYYSYGDSTLFSPEHAQSNAIAVAAIFGTWLTYVLIRASHLAGSVTDPHSKLDVESKQQTAFLTGLALVVTASLSVLNAPSIPSRGKMGESPTREIFLIGSGTVFDWLADRGIGRDKTFGVGERRLRVRVIDAASDDGLGIMVSAYSHGREQGDLPTILGLASYDVSSSERVLKSDQRPSSFFRIELARVDSIYFVRTGVGDWPTINEYDNDPLSFMVRHKELGAKVYGGQANSGTRRELEQITQVKRGIKTILECSQQWTELLGNLPTSLNLDAISQNERAVLYGTNFRTEQDKLLSNTELRQLAKGRNWSVIAISAPRPLLLVGRLRESNFLPSDVCMFLETIGWNDEGIDLTTRRIQKWTQRLDLLEVEPRN